MCSCRRGALQCDCGTRRQGFDELWQIWRQLQRTRPEDRSVVKRAQPWSTPCEKHADDVYYTAKDITNQGFTFDLSDLADLAPPVEEVVPSVGPRIFSQREQVDGMSPQQQMFAHSDRERHKVHMAVQYAYTKDDETRTAYKYASFPTLDAMVAYAEAFYRNRPLYFSAGERERPRPRARSRLWFVGSNYSRGITYS